jgi:hypothetical protein
MTQRPHLDPTPFLADLEWETVAEATYRFILERA